MFLRDQLWIMQLSAIFQFYVASRHISSHFFTKKTPIMSWSIKFRHAWCDYADMHDADVLIVCAMPTYSNAYTNLNQWCLKLILERIEMSM
jgi:hypothetical protein